MTHCHFPEGEWSVTVYCLLRQNAVLAHIAPTEGEDMEGRREWGVSPHTAKGDGTSQEGRGDTTDGASTGGGREITFMRTEHSINFKQIQDILLH